MYSTINSYRNEINRDDLATYAAEQRLARAADRLKAGQATPVARSLAAGRQVAIVMFALFALVVALAVPIVAAPLV